MLAVTSTQTRPTRVTAPPRLVAALPCLSPIKEPFSQGEVRQTFPRLKPHREGPCPNYMEMSPVSISEGVWL